MRIISDLFQKVVLFKIHLFEKQSRKYDEEEVYNALWSILFLLFSFTLIVFASFVAHLFDLKNHNTIIGMVIVILSLSNVYIIMKKLKRNRYIQTIHERYLQMDLPEKERNYKCGIYALIPIALHPIVCVLLLNLITLIK